MAVNGSRSDCETKIEYLLLVSSCNKGCNTSLKYFLLSVEDVSDCLCGVNSALSNLPFCVCVIGDND